MRCGICGKDTMLGYQGIPRPIMDAADLNSHKRVEHPEEYQAAREARRAKAQASKDAKAAEAQRVSAARLAASRPVVVRYLSKAEPITLPSSRLARWQLNYKTSDGGAEVRFPEAAAYQRYESVMAEIASLAAEVRVHLTAAWEMGTPVTLEHLDELDRAAVKSEELNDG